MGNKEEKLQKGHSFLLINKVQHIPFPENFERILLDSYQV